MDKTEEILSDERYKSKIEAISTYNLKRLAEDRLLALKQAKSGIEEIEPEKKDNPDYLELVANGMQELARLVLKKRAPN